MALEGGIMWKLWICLIVLTAAGNVHSYAEPYGGDGVSALSGYDHLGNTVTDEVRYQGSGRYKGSHRYDAGRHYGGYRYRHYGYDGYPRGYPYRGYGYSRPGPRHYSEFGYRRPYPRYYREYGYPGAYRYYYGSPYKNPYRYPKW